MSVYLAGCWVQCLFSFSNTFSLQLPRVSLPPHLIFWSVGNIIPFKFSLLVHLSYLLTYVTDLALSTGCSEAWLLYWWDRPPFLVLLALRNKHLQTLFIWDQTVMESRESECGHTGAPTIPVNLSGCPESQWFWPQNDTGLVTTLWAEVSQSEPTIFDKLYHKCSSQKVENDGCFTCIDHM